MKVPITTNFSNDLNDLIGKAEFTEEGIQEIHSLIEAGVIPTFAVGFVGEPDENGVYHNVELKEVSMLTHTEEYNGQDS